jgi:hypothetical protein
MTGRRDHAAAVGTVVAGGGAVAGFADWATRPPCPEHYVRLVDVVPIAAVLCGLLALLLAWRTGRATPWVRRPKDVRPATVVVSVLLTVAAALPALLAVASLVRHSGHSLDSECWTF